MNLESSLLLTDLYQLTMLHGYHEHGMEDTAVFEFFARELPPERNFLLAAGLEQVLGFLENARFTTEELDWLAGTGRFPQTFVERLAGWRFTGEVHAMPEGTAFFANEPILRVTAPIMEAQLIESRLINLLHFQSLIASKAVRSVLAAPGKLLVDFGMRRAHGAEAALLAARASYLAGFAGTATVLAGQRFGIPLYGTMAHSYVQAHDEETAAFADFSSAQSDNVVLLIDTYDTEAAARKVVALAPRLAERGIAVKAVRLDSGDLAEHARRVRAILDAGGLPDVRIFSSGNLDEYALRRLRDAHAPIDGFGVGTNMTTSADVPALDCAYKLTEYAGRGRRKHSDGKANWPGRKQVYRRTDAAGRFREDLLTLHDAPGDGVPLLQCVMRDGRRTAAPDTIETIRQRIRRQVDALPPPLRGLDAAPPYPVVIAPELRTLAREVDARLRQTEDGPAMP